MFCRAAVVTGIQILVTILSAAPCRAADKIRDVSPELSDDTVLAIVPPMQPRAGNLVMAEAMSKAGLADAESAAALAESYIATGRKMDDVKFYGMADAVLAAVKPTQNQPLNFLRAKATTKSLLHDFKSARNILNGILTTNSEDDRARRELFFLEVLQGDLHLADRHCLNTSGFQSSGARDLCALHLKISRGSKLQPHEKKILNRQIQDPDPFNATWARDLQMESDFIEIFASGKQSRPAQLRQAASKYATWAADDKPRLAYLADRLLAAGGYKETLELIPDTTQNFALATRRLAALRLLGITAAPSSPDGKLESICRTTIRVEAERGAIEHAREGAIIALLADRDMERAYQLALMNWLNQKEWVDAWLLLQSARENPLQKSTVAFDDWSRQQGGVVVHGTH